MKYLIQLFFVFSFGCCHAQSPDVELLQDLNAHEYRGWDNFMLGTSASIYPVMVVAPGSLMLCGYIKHDKQMMRNGLKTGIATALNLALTTGLKYAVNRQRPYTIQSNSIIKRTDSGPYSFPSGHTSSAFSVATAVSLATKKWYIIVPSYAYAGLVGYSRMRLGVHYPSDVLGGMLVGVASALVVWKADKWLNRRKTLKTAE